MTRKIAGICLMIFLMLSASILQAQNTTISEALPFDTTSVPNDELTKSIKELMTITGVMELGKQIGKNIAELKKSGQANQLPEEFYDRLLKEYESGQTDKWMVNAVVRIYRQKFTIGEVKTIIAFYQTPVGKKTISVLPAITQESMKEGEKIGSYLGMKVYYDLVREGKIK